MKKLTMVAGAVLLAVCAHAADNAMFKRLEPLVGTWEATVNGQQVRTVITSAAHGSVLMENMMPESENMMNAIFADGGSVTIAHYCAGGSQPRFRATRFEGGTADVKFLDGTNLGKDFMSGVKLTIVDTDHFTEVWRNTKDGKETQHVTFNYTRVK